MASIIAHEVLREIMDIARSNGAPAERRDNAEKRVALFKSDPASAGQSPGLTGSLEGNLRRHLEDALDNHELSGDELFVFVAAHDALRSPRTKAPLRSPHRERLHVLRAALLAAPFLREIRNEDIAAAAPLNERAYRPAPLEMAGVAAHTDRLDPAVIAQQAKETFQRLVSAIPVSSPAAERKSPPERGAMQLSISLTVRHSVELGAPPRWHRL
jgi:hypothetical protein